MTRLTRRLAPLFISLLAGVLAACGGGGGDGTPAPAPPPIGGIIGSGAAFGPIDSFGSIFRGGREFDTRSATFTIDGQPGTESDLAVGDVVTITATFNSDGTTATAQAVSFDDNVEGPIDSIDLTAGTLVVLGQTVIISSLTSFDDSISPPALAGLAVGNVVEVSGLPDANGAIVATRIELKPAGGVFEVTGEVSNLDTAATQFSINALRVDYGTATLDDFATGMPANGDLVEVKGSAFGAGGELLATRVERKDRLPGIEQGEGVEIEGFITRFVSAADFDVAGLPVTTGATTQFEGGTAADLALNVRVEIEGQMNAAGVLVASEVEFEAEDNIRLDATVDALDAVNNRVTLFGGVTVQVDSQTRMEDKLNEVRPFTVANLTVGDFVEVVGSEATPGGRTVLATRLERDDPEPDSRLRGFVESATDPGLVILGVTVQTDPGTQFEDENESPISAQQFFAQAVGRLVQVQGLWNGSALIAAEVELED